MRGVELLMSENEHEANAIARELEELNARRQELDRQTLDEAREMMASLDLAETYGIVLAKRAGIRASSASSPRGSSKNSAARPC